jgi:hypothetical protein
MAATSVVTATTTETKNNTTNGTGNDTGSNTGTPTVTYQGGIYDGQEVIMDKIVTPCVERFEKLDCIKNSEEAMKFLRKLRNYKELEALSLMFLHNKLDRSHIVRLLKKHKIPSNKLHKDPRKNEQLLAYLETTVRAVIDAFKVMTKKHK